MRQLPNRLRSMAVAACALTVLFLLADAGSAGASPVLQTELGNSANEVQWVVVHASGGQFRLCFKGECTGDLASSATAAQVETALNALQEVRTGSNTGAVTVLFSHVAGGGEYRITFDGGPLAHTDVPQLTAVEGTAPLLGNLLPRLVVRTLHETAVSRSDDRIDYTATVKNIGPDPTSGTVTLEVQLPGGQQTLALEAAGSGWTCSKLAPSSLVPARAVCTRNDALAAGASYPSVVVQTALGVDAPATAVATATASCACAFGPARATDQFIFAPPIPFELTAAEGGLFEATGPSPFGDPATQAGGHPMTAAADYQFSSKYRLIGGGSATIPFVAVETLKQVIVDLPRGQVGNANATPEHCNAGVLAASGLFCPPGSAVGGIEVILGQNGRVSGFPLFALEPEIGTPAQFGFQAGGNVYTLSTRLRPEDHYAISLELEPAPKNPVLASEATLCNYGAKLSGISFLRCQEPGETGANPQPLFTSPTRCEPQNPPAVRTRVNSWENPLVWPEKSFQTPSLTGCEKVPFAPRSNLEPTNRRADSPTGLTTEITMPTEGLLKGEGCHEEQGDPLSPLADECISEANLDTATVTFPKGMSINPAAADGLGACSEAQVGLGSNDPATCPESSKVGTIEIDTPILKETLTGNVYVAQQNHNPFNSTLGIYLVFSSPRDGITIKVAGKLVPDPVTGQLTSVFAESPEAPFSRLALHFNEGPRAPLINPPKCGTYAIHSEFSPWSAVNPANPTPDEIVSQDSVFEVDEGPDGTPCPTGDLAAKLNAGLQSNQAGGKSPFVLTLSREDGSQRFTGLEVSPPKGLTAYLKGIPYCPDATLAGISGAEETGRAELANASCPAASQVGTVLAGAGSGPFPFHSPGRAYLAGPYKGAPLSIAVVTPAVAGPFDLGNVVIRNALYIDPVTARVTAKSDPIPTILHGILLDVRDIRIALDRSGFTAAPTNCEPMAVDATASGEDGGRIDLSNRFQAGNCAALGFKPRLKLRLFGGTKRGAHPRLVAKLTARSGDANIAGASVALPHSEFLDQAHIRTVCTRVQFAAKACPAGSIYGEAEASTPLLDHPLSGPVYLRSSDNPLPDLVAALRGPDSQPIEVVLSGRIDSVKGGIRSSFEAVPDQPVSTFTLRMQGGKKGLLVNSRNICNSTSKATAKFTAQNGRTATLRPVLQNACKKAAKKHGKRAQHRKARASGVSALLRLAF